MTPFLSLTDSVEGLEKNLHVFKRVQRYDVVVIDEVSLSPMSDASLSDASLIACSTPGSTPESRRQWWPVQSFIGVERVTDHLADWYSPEQRMCNAESRDSKLNDTRYTVHWRDSQSDELVRLLML